MSRPTIDPPREGGAHWLDDLRRDVRFGLRSLVRSPGFTAVALLCLALGIGANAALFSVLNAVLLRPLPYPEPERLLRLYETWGDKQLPGSVSAPNYHDWAEQSTAFEALTAWQPGSRNLQEGGDAERIRTVEATPNLFQMLKVRPLRGRVFSPGQDEAGRSQVVVIGEPLWRRRFGADPALVGRTVQLDGSPYLVIGILPAAAAFPPLTPEGTDAWLVLAPNPRLASARGAHFLAVTGRLKPGVSAAQASAQLKEIAARLAKAYPDQQAGRSAQVMGLRESIVGETPRTALLILLGAVFLVLLIACANVANLLMVRAAVRQREVAVRLALGASRSRLVRQLLVESLVLALGGALLGLLLARWGLSALTPLVRVALPLSGVPLDGRVFLFLLAVAAFSGVVFGLAPALQAVRGDVRESLVEGGRTTAGGGHQRFRNGLVVAEIALSLVLLVGAGLLLRGFLKVSGTEPGFVSQGVLTAHVAVPTSTPRVVPRFFRPLLERVRALPGVRSAAVISMLPIQEAWTNASYTVEGRPVPPLPQQPMAEIRMASPGFFTALGIPLLRGRDFTERDGEQGLRMAIVNEVLVREQFPNEDPLHHRILMGGDLKLEIVGVVGAVHQAGLDQAPLAEVYLPYGGADGDYGELLSDAALVVKTAGSPGALAGDVRRALRAVDPGVPLYKMLTMDQVIADSLASRRLNLWLLALFAGIALALSAAGLYGVISYLVAQRTREIGMRMALGAQAKDVIRLVMGQGSRLTVLGIAVGALGALALTRWLESLLDGVSARDPLTFLSIAALLAAVALLASWLPARRAARVEPIIAIRNE